MYLLLRCFWLSINQSQQFKVDWQNKTQSLDLSAKLKVYALAKLQKDHLKSEEKKENYKKNGHVTKISKDPCREEHSFL